jgi:hypothetical protein
MSVYNEMNAKLEPEACAWIITPGEQDYKDAAMVSLAISTKRQADALERIADTLCARHPTGQSINDMFWTVSDVIQGAIGRGTL